MNFDELRDKLCSVIPWQERALLISEYHIEQEDLHAAPIEKFKKKGWTLKDTAKKLGVSYSSIYWELQLAKALKAGKLENAPSKNQAIFLISQDGANTKVELKYARTFISGTLLTTAKYNGTELCIVKLSAPLRTPHLDVDIICVPRYQCRIYKDD